MKVAVTGWQGFLAKKLRERTDIIWVDQIEQSDVLLHLGSPTFTNLELSRENAKVMHNYVSESIQLINNYDRPVIFASTTGVDDIRLDHLGSTSYNLSKLFLENYVINKCNKYLILRIGTIISKKISDIQLMKSDRVQARIMSKNYSNIDDVDYYLDVDIFVKLTADAILLSQTGILNYPLTKLSRTELILYGKQ
jgi:nucleoside-diphosphate-sugar epimerase